MSKSFEFTVIERKGEQIPVFYVLTPDGKNLEFSMWEYNNIEELLASAGADVVHTLETGK